METSRGLGKQFWRREISEQDGVACKKRDVVVGGG